MMTTEIETAIERMVEEHGIDAVDAALEPLIGKFKWHDWLAVCRYAQRVHRESRQIGHNQANERNPTLVNDRYRVFGDPSAIFNPPIFPMPRVIKNYEFWSVQRLQPIPHNLKDILAGCSSEQTDDFLLGIGIVGLVDPPGQMRRSLHGLNRAAQRRFPGRGVWIGLTESIMACWEMFGWIALISAVGKPKIELEKGRYAFEQPHHVLETLAVEVVDAIKDEEEVFVSGVSYAAHVESGTPLFYFRVAAETNLGRYKFAVWHYDVPQWEDVCQYCRWHTRFLE